MSLIKGFKETCLAADLKEKGEILNVLVDTAPLRDSYLFVSEKKPFGVLPISVKEFKERELAGPRGIEPRSDG